MNVDYNVQIWKEGDQFIAQATPIDVASSGKTPDEAKAALDEAVHLFLATAADQVLETGFGQSKGKSSKRRPIF